ncbi:MAG: hypothetical protein O3A13_11405 [Proteobacteria bacterium]|nr:hypothetical protein [Pseudomonadota bacterium]
MNKLIILLLAVVPGACALADDADDAGAKLHEYFDEFNAKNVELVANHIYSTPVHVGGGNGHSVLSDPAAAVTNLTGLYAQLEAQGWVESRIENLKVCIASETLALVDTRFSRIDKNGEPIPPAIRTTLYVLQKIDGDWRIVAFYGHDSRVRPSCD